MAANPPRQPAATLVELLKVQAREWRDLYDEALRISEEAERNPEVELPGDLWDAHFDHPIYDLFRLIVEHSGIPMDALRAAAWRINSANGLAPLRRVRRQPQRTADPERAGFLEEEEHACDLPDLQWVYAELKKCDGNGATEAILAEFAKRHPADNGLYKTIPAAASAPRAEVMRAAASNRRSRQEKEDPHEPCSPKLQEYEGHPVHVTNPVLSVRIVGEESVSVRPPERPCIISYGKRCYQIGSHRPVVVTDRFDNLLQAFIKQPAMDESQMVSESGQDDAVKLLRSLTTWLDGMFAPAIELPAAKNCGGYHVSIRSV